MHPILAPLAEGFAPTGEIADDAARLLRHHGKPHTADHAAAVADVARDVAMRYGVDRQRAWHGSWLHDIAAVIPTPERLAAAMVLGLDVLPEERTLPMILHQKLGVVIARELLGVDDPGILSAIGCHTTLKPGASPLDMVVFLADKIAWDQPGHPPYLDALDAALETSLQAASLVYLAWLWEQRATLPVVHPWMAAAYRALSADASLSPVGC